MSIDCVKPLAKSLADCGIKYAFGVTGSGASLQLICALEQNNIPYYPVAHEAAAALMAGACCSDGKTRAAAISIKGPGFANFIPGILSNYYEGRPALTISEAYSSSDPLYRKHKRLEHYPMCSGIVKSYAQADLSGEVSPNFIRLANREFPGPIHLDLVNKPAEVSPEIDDQAKPQEYDYASKVNEAIIRIKKSNRPAVILGSLAKRKLGEFNWNNLKVPVLTTASAKGCVNEHGTYAAGIVTGEIKELSPEQTILGKSDLIVAFGLRNTEVITTRLAAVPLIIIDVVGGDAHHGFEPEICLVNTDISVTAAAVFAELSRKEWDGEVVENCRQKVWDELFHDQWLTPGVFRRIQDLTSPDDTTLVLDVGLFCTIGETVWKASRPDSFCSSSNGRFMGTAIPTAIGAGISSPGKKVICVMGDGGIRPYLAEIKLAVELTLPILFVLMSDGKYGTVAASAIPGGAGSSAYVINNPTWWRVVEAMGCPSAPVSNFAELDKITTGWMQGRGPLFIEMHFDSLKYINITKRLR